MSLYYLQISVHEIEVLKVQIYTKGILKSEEKGRRRSKRIAIISGLGVSRERESVHCLALKSLPYYNCVWNKEGVTYKVPIGCRLHKYIAKCFLTVAVFIFPF